MIRFVPPPWIVYRLAMFQDAVDRRGFVLSAAFGAFALALPVRAESPGRKMTINLMCGMIGVQARQEEAVELAHRHGFESVEAMPSDLARLGDQEMAALLANMKQKNVVFGAASLPVEFRQDEAKFEGDLSNLPRLAAGLQRAGVTRAGTWISPGSQSLTYRQNFNRHSGRLRKVSSLLKDHGIRLGLEYVGTKTLRDRFKFPFVHAMAEMQELIAEIGTGNVGLVLDSWHWWNANDSVQDILAMQPTDIVAVDLNDAPAGIPKEQQVDNRRELPAATGVIPAKEFLSALQKIGYDGPVRAEPFSKPLNDLDNDAACAKTAEAMRKAFDLIEKA